MSGERLGEVGFRVGSESEVLEDLVTTAPPKSREAEAAKGRGRFEKRMSREVAARTA